MKKDRHARTEVNCEVCGNLFTARTERVEKGLGRFCSKICFDIEQRKRREVFFGRKDLARFYKVGGRLAARWYDENGKTRSTPYPRWWWEMNVGEIPEGMIVLVKDGNPLSTEPSNFELGTKSDALRKGNATRKADPEKWESYLSKLRKKRSKQVMVSGEKHYKWRGGVPDKYPKEFFAVRDFVIGRDNGKCQICSRVLLKKHHVHHRDGNRNHNDSENLITLCASCHNKVHGMSQESLPIMALRSELHWNQGE